MLTRRAARVAALGLAITLTPAGVLIGGWHPTQPAKAVDTATSSSPRTETCSKTITGRVTNCPTRPPIRLIPAAARDNRKLVAPVTNLAALVDTRTWTSGGGNTYPGAQAPFGMIQWSPDTMPGRVDGGGYTFTDKKLYGYSLTHVSGTGCRAAGDVPVLPMTGALPAGDPTNVTTAFSHSGEVAQAGYYAARSNGTATITSQFSATAHAAIANFAFPKTKSADLLIKLRGSQEGALATHAVTIGRDEIQGSVTSGNFCNELSGKVGPQKYTLYFDITFDRPFTAHKIVTEKGRTGPDAVFLTFDASSDQTVGAKVAISYVNAANAESNWTDEIPGWDVQTVRAAAQANWNALLGEISVAGGSEKVTQEFYSLLYKDFLQPNIISDVNGKYRGSDFKVHSVSFGHSQYGMFSGWDIYHSLAQLQAMLDPTAASDMAQSLVNLYSQNGILPQWGYLNLDNYAQVGDPSDAVIADYYAFGARNFATTTAFNQMFHQATTTGNVRPGTALENKYRFLPQDATYPCCDAHGYVSSLLEYDNADFALAQYAKALGGHASTAAALQHRANNWTFLFNKASNLLVTRFKSGKFQSGVTKMATSHYIEGTAYEYLWDVPNNYAALFAKLGGIKKVGPLLRSYLSKPNGFGTHAFLANEFDLGEQFAPDYAGYPSETQWVVNNLRRSLYRPGPFGLNNNDDLGAESSQFIWEMLGMYPENPGSGNLVFASPGFQQITISLPTGNTIKITAPGATGSKFYVDSLKINGTAYKKLWIPFSTLASGATMSWTLGTKPGPWGNAKADAPPSYGPPNS
jgi:predicted alpha-1,2-mannosidase